MEISDLPKIQSGHSTASIRTRGHLSRATILTCLGAFGDKGQNKPPHCDVSPLHLRHSLLP